MANFTLNINGTRQEVDVDPSTPLLWVLRDHLNLVGTKYGCGISMCGACTVNIGGTAARACSVPIKNVKDAEILTIEGLSEDGNHPIQRAWIEHDVPQCGYCQTGQMMSAFALLQDNPSPSDDEISKAMNGNICRCGTYNKIKKAVKTAAKNL